MLCIIPALICLNCGRFKGRLLFRREEIDNERQAIAGSVERSAFADRYDKCAIAGREMSLSRGGFGSPCVYSIYYVFIKRIGQNRI